MEYLRYFSPVLMGSVSIFILLKDDFRIDAYLQFSVHDVVSHIEAFLEI